MKKPVFLSGLVLIAIFCPVSGQTTLSATDIIRKADEKFRGEKSSIIEMSMTIVRPTWQRTVSSRTWSSGNDYSLTLITAPAKEKGQTFLKRGNEMWNWNPSISRMIKLPPSMMSQGWMGSDYTIDDIMKESSLVRDYTHKIIREEKYDNRDCFVIEMIATEDADVIWGKQIRWVDRENFLFLKAELYDEDGYLIRTETGSDIRMMDGRLIPSRLELIPAEDEGNRTVIQIDKITFNPEIADSFFSIQNMKSIR